MTSLTFHIVAAPFWHAMPRLRLCSSPKSSDRPNQRRSERQYDGRRYERQDKGKLKSCASVLIPLRLELKNNASGKARTWGGSFDFLADDNLGVDECAPRHHP